MHTNRAFWLGASMALFACHTAGAVRDLAPRAESRASATASRTPAQVGEAPAAAETRPEVLPCMPWMPPTPIQPALAPTDEVVAIVGEQIADPLRVRLDALERKVGMLEAALRAKPEVPSPGLGAQALGMLPLVLGLLCLMALAAAIAAVARARRTRTEVTRLQAAGSLLAQRHATERDDELDARLRQILEIGT